MAPSDVGSQRVVPWASTFFATLGPVRTYPFHLPSASPPGAISSTVRVPMGVVEVGFPTATIVHRWGALPPTAPLTSQYGTRSGKQERAAGASASSGGLRLLCPSEEYEYQQLLAAIPTMADAPVAEEGLAGVGIRRLAYPQQRDVLVSLAVADGTGVIQAYARLRDEYEQFDIGRGLRRSGWGRAQRAYVEQELARRGQLRGAGEALCQLLVHLRQGGWEPQLQYRLFLLLIARTRNAVEWSGLCAAPILHSMQRVGWSPETQYDVLEQLAMVPIAREWLLADNGPRPAFQFAEPRDCDPGRLAHALTVLQPLAEAKVAAYRERQARKAVRHAARQPGAFDIRDIMEDAIDGLAERLAPEEATTDSVPDALFHLFTRLATASRESLWMATAWLGAVVEQGVPLETAHQFLMSWLQNLSDNERPVALRLLGEHSHVFAAAMTDPTADLETLFALFDRNGSGALHALHRSLTAWRLARIRALPPGPPTVYPPLDPEMAALLRYVRGDDEPGEE